MRKLLKLAFAAASFFAAWTSSNEAKAQLLEPRFYTHELSYEIGFQQWIYGVNYRVYSAGYEVESMAYDDPTGTVIIEQERYEEQEEIGVYLWGFRVFGLSIGYVETTISITYINADGYECVVTATLKCLVFDFNFWGRMMPTVSGDAPQLQPLSTDTYRLPALVPQKN